MLSFVYTYLIRLVNWGLTKLLVLRIYVRQSVRLCCDLIFFLFSKLQSCRLESCDVEVVDFPLFSRFLGWLARVDFISAQEFERLLLEDKTGGLTLRLAFLPFFEDKSVLLLIDAVGVGDARASAQPAFVKVAKLVRSV